MTTIYVITGILVWIGWIAFYQWATMWVRKP
jgi:hypothetical protein